MESTEKRCMPKITPEIEGDSAQIFMAFTIKWNDQDYHGTFIATLSENLWIEDCEIEWSNDESPDFGEFEESVHIELEEKLLDEVLKKYNVR